MALAPGSRVGQYEVIAPLGEWGMGKVWRARHTALKRDDALKVGFVFRFRGSPAKAGHYVRGWELRRT